MAKPRTFGQFLGQEMKRRDLQRRQLADLIGISSEKSIDSWREDRSRPQADNLAQLGKVFGWDMNLVLAYLGLPMLEGTDRIATGIARRPLLLELFLAARHLPDAELEVIVTATEALNAKRERLDANQKAGDDN